MEIKDINCKRYIGQGAICDNCGGYSDQHNVEEEIPVKLGLNQEIRDEKGRYIPGVSGNPLGQNAGRPRKGLKEYDRAKFNKMPDEEKEEFLSKISPIDRYKMAEGNPENPIDITTKGESINPEAVLKANQAIDNYLINDNTGNNNNGNE